MKMCDSADRLLKILEFGKWEVDPKTGIISINNQDFDALCNKEPFEKCYSVDSDPIDRGKFSTVYHCVSLKTGEEYAAKICSKRRMGVDYMADLVHEIAVCLLLRDCENAVKIVDVFNADSELILILEFAPGGDLQTILDEDLVPYEASVIRILRQVLDALRFMHARNIVHLDIKPQNLVLMGAFPDCCLKLCDFEISRKLTHGFEVREILGTADYVAPEIIHYEPITTKTDMWSFGILTYVLLTGFLPFGGETDQETFIEITKCELDFPEELFEDTSNEAIDFIKKLIVRKPLLRMSAEECLNHPWMNNNQNAATTCIQKSNINSQKHISPPQQQSNIIPQVPAILYPQSNINSEKLMNSHSQSNINLQKPSYPQSNTNLQKSSSSHLQSITPQQPNSSYSQSKITPQSLSSYCNVLAQQKHASPHTQSSSISYPHSTTQSVPRLSLPLQSNYVEYKHSDLTSPLNYFKPFIDSTNYKLFSQTPTDIYYKQEFQTPLRSHLSSPQTPNSSRKLDENEFNISLQKAFEILESDTTNSDTKVNNSNILSPGYLSPQGYDVNLQPRRYLSVHSSTNSLNKGFSRQNLDHLKNFSKSREILAERLMNSSQKKLISKSRDRLFDGRYRYAKSDSGLIDNIFSSQSDEVLFEANLHPTPYKPLDHSYSYGNVLPIISYLSNCTDDIKSKYKYPDRTKNGFNTLRNKGERPVGTTGRLSERAIYNTANDNYFKENKSSKILKPENNLKTTDRGNRESRDFSNSNVNTTQKIQTPRIRKESEKSSNNDRRSQNINNKSITNLKDAHYNKNSTQNRILPRKNSISHTEMRILERKRRKKEKENRDDSKEESKSIKANLRMNSLSPIRNFKKSQNGTVNSKKNSPNNSDNNLNKGNQSEKITEESFFLHPIKENCKRNNQLQTVKTQTCTAEVLKSKNKADKSTDDKNNFVNRYRDKAKPESKFLTQTKSVINHQTTENKKGLDTITHVNNKARKTRNRDLRSTECVEVKNQNLFRKESFKSAHQKTTDINSVTKNYSQKFPDNSQKKVSENENTATKIDIQELEFKSEINFSNERKRHENVKKLENEEIENFDNNDDALTNIIEDNVNKYNTAVLRRKNSSEQACRVDSGIFSRSTSIDSSTSAESVCTVRAIQIKKSVPTFDFSFLNIFNNDDFNILNFNASYINEVQFHSLPGSVEKGKMAKTFELFKLEYSTSDSKLYDKNACNIPLLNDKKIELYKNGNSNALQNEIPETKFNKHGKQKHIYSKIHKGRLCNFLESRDKNSNELHNIEYQKVSELNGKSNENQTENLKELCDNETSDHKKQNANDLTDQKQNVNKNCISLDNPVIFNKFNQEDKSNLIDNLNQNKLKDINYHKDKEDSLKDFLRFKAQTPAPNFSLTRQVKNQTASKSEDSLIQKPSTFYAISKSRSMNIDSPLLGEPRPWGGICEGSVNRAREGFGKKSVKIDMILRKLSEPSHDSKNFETSDVNCKN